LRNLWSLNSRLPGPLRQRLQQLEHGAVSLVVFGREVSILERSQKKVWERNLALPGPPPRETLQLVGSVSTHRLLRKLYATGHILDCDVLQEDHHSPTRLWMFDLQDPRGVDSRRNQGFVATFSMYLSMAAFYSLSNRVFYSFAGHVRRDTFLIFLLIQRARSEIEQLVYWMLEILFASQIAFCDLHRCVRLRDVGGESTNCGRPCG